MLEAVGLTKTFRKKKVLDNVSFSLKPGECLGIAGHNGSGKSTLMEIAAQVLAPDSGQLLHDGANVLGDRAFMRGMVGYAPQRDSLPPDLRVGEALAFWQKLYGVSGDVFADDSPAAMMGLFGMRDKKIARLSGGMKKRVSIALALLHSPRCLLLDEVFSALDRLYRERLAEWLTRHKQNGNSILYCSHEIGELRTFCDRILVLREGKAAFYGEMAAFPAEGRALDELLNSSEA